MTSKQLLRRWAHLQYPLKKDTPFRFWYWWLVYLIGHPPKKKKKEIDKKGRGRRRWMDPGCTADTISSDTGHSGLRQTSHPSYWPWCQPTLFWPPLWLIQSSKAPPPQSSSVKGGGRDISPIVLSSDWLFCQLGVNWGDHLVQPIDIWGQGSQSPRC